MTAPCSRVLAQRRHEGVAVGRIARQGGRVKRLAVVGERAHGALDDHALERGGWARGLLGSRHAQGW